jgi:Acyltransferase family
MAENTGASAEIAAQVLSTCSKVAALRRSVKRVTRNLGLSPYDRTAEVHRMASPVAATTTRAEQREAGAPRAVRPGYHVALGYLRGFLVVLVLAHHSVLAYFQGAPPPATSLMTDPKTWRAFPVVDPLRHFAGFDLFVGFNDTFFMSLMFFVSGLFVWSSLKRKGNPVFVRERMKRLGIPFLFAAAIVAPLAYYPSYLLTGAHGFSGYLHDWLSFGDWPTGPGWFIWLLLAFDLAAAALFAVAPNFGDLLGRLCSRARERPARFFLGLVGASAVAYVPMATIFGPGAWTSIGPFQFQTARLFHYAVYFFAGIGVGAYGIEQGLLAPDGILALRWLRWTVLALGTFAISVAFLLVAISRNSPMSPLAANVFGGAIYSIACASISFAFMALFVRFMTHRYWFFDSLSDNEYGMYIIHYTFVSWLQFVFLSLALPAIEKGILVFAGVLLLSWSASAALRSIPAVRRIV